MLLTYPRIQCSCVIAFIYFYVAAGTAATSGSAFSLRSGKKSIWRACARRIAVPNVILTSPERSFVTYGRDTFMRFANWVWLSPSRFIWMMTRRKNAHIKWFVVTGNSVTYLLRTSKNGGSGWVRKLGEMEIVSDSVLRVSQNLKAKSNEESLLFSTDTHLVYSLTGPLQ